MLFSETAALIKLYMSLLCEEAAHLNRLDRGNMFIDSFFFGISLTTIVLLEVYCFNLLPTELICALSHVFFSLLVAVLISSVGGDFPPEKLWWILFFLLL